MYSIGRYPVIFTSLREIGKTMNEVDIYDLDKISTYETWELR